METYYEPPVRPAEKPDLNPIELVWGAMKTYLRDKCKPKNLEQLKKGIKAYWKTLTPALCTRYINYLQMVMPAVVKEKGAPSGYGRTSCIVTTP